MKKTILTILLPCMLLSAFAGSAQKGLPSEKEVTATVNTHYPAHEDFNETLVKRITVPAGFNVSVAATGLGKPRMMAIADNGALYVTRRDQGDVLMLTDKDGDGKYEELKTVWVKFPDVHGIAIRNGMMYLCSSKMLKRATIGTNGMLTDTVTLINDLPDGGQHDNRVVAFGPDSLLYVSVGSNCNDCAETNPENATIIRMQPDGTERKIFARGLRNTIGFDWQPQTQQMWGADNGTDFRGDDLPAEELNRIEENGDYGWPWVYGKQEVDQTREDPTGTTKAEYAKTTKPSIMDIPGHSAPIDFKFLTRAGKFPKDYRDDALLCLHGSWNRKAPQGYKVVRIKFEKGQPVAIEDFFSGFLSTDGASRFGRPAGLAISNKSDLFISDDENGVIYRVTATTNK